MANLVLKNNTSGGKTSVTADNFIGNASTASKWLTARTLTLSGDASGSVSIDGSGNMTLSVTVANDSHTHAWAKITGKPSTFAPSSHTHSYLPLSGGTLTGNLTVNTSIYVASANHDSLDGAALRLNNGNIAGLNAIYTADAADAVSEGINFYRTDGKYDNFRIYNGTIYMTTAVPFGGSSGSASYTLLHSGNYSSWCAPASHSHSYLPLSGGAMTGNISYKGSQATYEMIRFINNRDDTYGNGISIGGGGATIIGGGEAATAMQGLISSGGSEEMLIGNDGAIKFYSNCQDGVGAAKVFTMTAGGDFNAPSISTSANIGCHINGRADLSCLCLTNEQWTGYGTVDPNGNLTAVVGRVYFRIV